MTNKEECFKIFGQILIDEGGDQDVLTFFFSLEMSICIIALMYVLYCIIKLLVNEEKKDFLSGSIYFYFGLCLLCKHVCNQPPYRSSDYLQWHHFI